MPLTSPPAAAWLGSDAVAPIVEGAHVAHMVVTTRGGPLVTPQLFSVAGGRVWIVTPRNSVKARVVRVRPHVGLLLRSGRRSVLLRGTAEVLEPWGVEEVTRLVAQAPHALQAALEYAFRNGGTMVGYLGDLLRLPPPTAAIPYDRVLIAVDIDRGLAWNGSSVSSEHGDWDGAATPARSADTETATRVSVREGVPGGLPGDVSTLAGAPRAVAVGWETPGGPVALPGRWNPGTWRATLPGALVERLRLPARASACITFDRSTSYRPSRYRGLVLRGPARLERSAAATTVALMTRRVTSWTGFEVRTVTTTPSALHR